ncbi:MAG: DUF805 domain-containing protein [Muribaculaceae bacterium]|nr:DUF805 domain-containing protein [Muribaculaceae bacterium]
MYQYRVSFGDAVSRAFSNYCKFSGRASRSEYWWFSLFTCIVSWIFLILGYFCGFDSSIYKIGNNLWSLVIFLPSFGLLFRRLHDIGRSGWNWLWLLLPVIGWIIVIVYLCKDSEMSMNKYGDVPNVIGLED